MTETRHVEIRAEIVLHVAAKRMGVSTCVLERRLLAAGVPVMGGGKARSVFVDDLVAFQARREADGRRAVTQRDLVKDHVKGKADARLDALLTECRRGGRR